MEQLRYENNGKSEKLKNGRKNSSLILPDLQHAATSWKERMIIDYFNIFTFAFFPVFARLLVDAWLHLFLTLF